MNWNKENLAGKVLAFFDNDLQSLRLISFDNKFIDGNLNYHEISMTNKPSPWLLSSGDNWKGIWNFTLDLEGAKEISKKKYHFLIQYREEKEKEMMNNIFNYVESYVK